MRTGIELLRSVVTVLHVTCGCDRRQCMACGQRAEICEYLAVADITSRTGLQGRRLRQDGQGAITTEKPAKPPGRVATGRLENPGAIRGGVSNVQHWYAAGLGILRCGPFRSQAEAWEAMRYTPRADGLIHPADTRVWPEAAQ